jgi:hypothetical protein
MNESTTWHAETFGRDAHSNHDSEPNAPCSRVPSTDQGTSGSETEKLRSSDIAEHQAPRNYSRWQWACILVAIYSSQFLYGLDTTIPSGQRGHDSLFVSERRFPHRMEQQTYTLLAVAKHTASLTLNGYTLVA